MFDDAAGRERPSWAKTVTPRQRSPRMRPPAVQVMRVRRRLARLVEFSTRSNASQMAIGLPTNLWRRRCDAGSSSRGLAARRHGR
jgi:hypothetical protein